MRTRDDPEANIAQPMMQRLRPIRPAIVDLGPWPCRPKVRGFQHANHVRLLGREENPEDFPYGSPEYRKADEEYMRDLLRVMGEDLDDRDG